MAGKGDADVSRLDEAARAGWLYYVAGNTQDEIARKLGVSRQSAQRLVSLAVTERLIKVRLDHPIARCMELGRNLADRFGLRSCEVVPSDPATPSSIVGIAQAAAGEMERHLKSNEPKIIAFGTGRALRASVDQLPTMDCPQHKIVSLLGNMMSDGSASAYNVIIRMADRVNARHYPMPLPVFARSKRERTLLHNQEPVHNILALAKDADVTFVGVGNMGETAPLFVDGFISRDEMSALTAAGAIGEITSWVYDRNGELIEGLTNDLVASAPLGKARDKPVIGIAAGEGKVDAILGALRGELLNGLITNELTADRLLAR
ncbi:sugar-binding transcriptional regulator [Stappia sp. 28M-7]|jgi:DNA-binding transcriptional regulator LsrR (DeoR family)|uniref:sugar-binding transcriptional regulator n=1 Tax=Stappia sp. 28M-7 TaxID=2762596 RepID=UPI00163D07DF|nr:sugar-binding transcriptional regulator [Stappia sp. 28M-7]MBC2859166.1 sugar-binding transcriptional regulator [Stappia sp. 28M-7]